MRYDAPWPGMTWVDMMLAAVAARDRAEVARREMRFFLDLANPPKFPPGDILGLDLLTLMDKPRKAELLATDPEPDRGMVRDESGEIVMEES